MEPESKVDRPEGLKVINEVADSDPEALKMTSPRKTELREKKSINYTQLNRVGNSIVSPDESEDG